MLFVLLLYLTTFLPVLYIFKSYFVLSLKKSPDYKSSTYESFVPVDILIDSVINPPNIRSLPTKMYAKLEVLVHLSTIFSQTVWFWFCCPNTIKAFFPNSVKKFADFRSYAVNSFSSFLITLQFLLRKLVTLEVVSPLGTSINEDVFFAYDFFIIDKDYLNLR